jgi:hypothetical protein
MSEHYASGSDMLIAVNAVLDAAWCAGKRQ